APGQTEKSIRSRKESGRSQPGSISPLSNRLRRRGQNRFARRQERIRTNRVRACFEPKVRGAEARQQPGNQLSQYDRYVALLAQTGHFSGVGASGKSNGSKAPVEPMTPPGLHPGY